MTNTIAIIGGGISGTLTVLQCIKQSRTPLSIIWFDAYNRFYKGLAYSTLNEDHLLNVRAGNMSMFPDEPDHFTHWLAQKHPQYTSKDFVPRKLYGDYVEATFHALKNSNPLVSVIQLAEEVCMVDKKNEGFEITTNHAYQAQKLILAFGNFLPAHPRSVSNSFITSQNYFQNAFDPSLADKVLPCDHITIIGSGLTMIDLIRTLVSKSYKGTIQVISPHGYIPQSHDDNPLPAVEPFIEKHKKYSLSELVSLVNEQLKKAKKEQLSPHSVIDSMRPYLQSIWLNFPLTEKQQFLRHLRHKWGVARHRAPAQSLSVFDQLMAGGQLVLQKGRIYDIRFKEKEFEVCFSTSKSSEKSFKTDLLINCTGPESDYSKLKAPLIQYLMKNRLIDPDPIKYGLNAQKDGQLSENLFTLGPPLKGILWESVAVPEIRLQAKELATKIICD